MRFNRNLYGALINRGASICAVFSLCFAHKPTMSAGGDQFFGDEFADGGGNEFCADEPDQLDVFAREEADKEARAFEDEAVAAEDADPFADDNEDDNEAGSITPPLRGEVSNDAEGGKKKKLAGSKRKPSGGTEIIKIKKKRAPRRRKTAALSQAIAELESDNAAAEKIVGAELGEQLASDIRAGAREATEALEVAERVYESTTAAVEQIRKYTQLIKQLKKQGAKSKLLEKTCAVLERNLAYTKSSRETVARLPAMYRDLWLRHEAFMRNSVASLADRQPYKLSRSHDGVVRSDANGSSQLVPAQSSALIVTGGAGGGGGQLIAAARTGDGKAFELHMESAPQFVNATEQLDHIRTSLMRTNFDPRATATGHRVQRLDRQKRAARSHAQELAPSLFAGTRARLLDSASVQRTLLPPPPPRPALTAPKSTTAQRRLQAAEN